MAYKEVSRVEITEVVVRQWHAGRDKCEIMREPAYHVIQFGNIYWRHIAAVWVGTVRRPQICS
jgi:hypothetical protein